jgi:hypothetical protein
MGRCQQACPKTLHFRSPTIGSLAKLRGGTCIIIIIIIIIIILVDFEFFFEVMMFLDLK